MHISQNTIKQSYISKFMYAHEALKKLFNMGQNSISPLLSSRHFSSLFTDTTQRCCTSHPRHFHYNPPHQVRHGMSNKK